MLIRSFGTGTRAARTYRATSAPTAPPYVSPHLQNHETKPRHTLTQHNTTMRGRHELPSGPALARNITIIAPDQPFPRSQLDGDIFQASSGIMLWYRANLQPITGCYASENPTRCRIVLSRLAALNSQNSKGVVNKGKLVVPTTEKDLPAYVHDKLKACLGTDADKLLNGVQFYQATGHNLNFMTTEGAVQTYSVGIDASGEQISGLAKALLGDNLTLPVLEMEDEKVHLTMRKAHITFEAGVAKGDEAGKTRVALMRDAQLLETITPTSALVDVHDLSVRLGGSDVRDSMQRIAAEMIVRAVKEAPNTVDGQAKALKEALGSPQLTVLDVHIHHVRTMSSSIKQELTNAGADVHPDSNVNLAIAHFDTARLKHALYKTGLLYIASRQAAVKLLMVQRYPTRRSTVDALPLQNSINLGDLPPSISRADLHDIVTTKTNTLREALHFYRHKAMPPASASAAVKDAMQRLDAPNAFTPDDLGETTVLHPLFYTASGTPASLLAADVDVVVDSLVATSTATQRRMHVGSMVPTDNKDGNPTYSIPGGMLQLALCEEIDLAMVLVLTSGSSPLAGGSTYIRTNKLCASLTLPANSVATGGTNYQVLQQGGDGQGAKPAARIVIAYALAKKKHWDSELHLAAPKSNNEGKTVLGFAVTTITKGVRDETKPNSLLDATPAAAASMQLDDLDLEGLLADGDLQVEVSDEEDEPRSEQERLQEQASSSCNRAQASMHEACTAAGEAARDAEKALEEITANNKQIARSLSQAVAAAANKAEKAAEVAAEAAVEAIAAANRLKRVGDPARAQHYISTACEAKEQAHQAARKAAEAHAKLGTDARATLKRDRED